MLKFGNIETKNSLRVPGSPQPNFKFILHQKKESSGSIANVNC